MRDAVDTARQAADYRETGAGQVRGQPLRHPLAIGRAVSRADQRDRLVSSSYFPYAFGLLFGLGVYGLYEKQGAAFLPQYKALLASTGSADIASVCASVGIDVRDRAFWRGSLDVIAANVERFEALAGK